MILGKSVWGAAVCGMLLLTSVVSAATSPGSHIDLKTLPDVTAISVETESPVQLAQGYRFSYHSRGRPYYAPVYVAPPPVVYGYPAYGGYGYPAYGGGYGGYGYYPNYGYNYGGYPYSGASGYGSYTNFWLQYGPRW